MLDKLYERQKIGTVRGEVMVLERLANLAVEKGVIASHSVEQKDSFRALKQKMIVVYTDDEVEKMLLYDKAGGNSASTCW